MAQLLVMYKTPKDTAAFDSIILKSTSHSRKKYQASENTRSAEAPLQRRLDHPAIIS